LVLRSGFRAYSSEIQGDAMTSLDFFLFGAPLVGTVIGLLSHWLLKKLGAFPFEERAYRRTLKAHGLSKAELADLSSEISLDGIDESNESLISRLMCDDRTEKRGWAAKLRHAMRNLLLDRVFALFMLLALAPLLLVISIAIKVDSAGPVVFTQRRRGLDGRVFQLYKFRTMRLHTESRHVVMQATMRDPRISKLGAFLRRTSLDELPQFWNVLIGDMSVVGPRPLGDFESDEQYERMLHVLAERHNIKPGITGWAQIHGFRGANWRPEKRREEQGFVAFYALHRTLWFDLKIMAMAFAMWFSRGASVSGHQG
jgi:lipopolysaccharide/colanic/teichoic acid biosynthesis glycosyltransferase